jgi:hypothetical protein
MRRPSGSIAQSQDVSRFFPGGNFVFPFGSTAGLHDSPNVRTIKLCYLPPKKTFGVKCKPIKSWLAENGRRRRHFPVGTTIGEWIIGTWPNGEEFIVELRTRKLVRGDNGKCYYESDVFRPWPTSYHFAKAVQAAVPGWTDDSEAKALVEWCNSPANGKFETVSDQFGVFHGEGFVDEVPPISEKLIKKLYAEAVLKSCHGEEWKPMCYAPTAKAGSFSFVPEKYGAHVLKIDNTTCASCHNRAGKPIGDLDGELLLYGHMYGDFGVFSFHEFGDAAGFDEDLGAPARPDWVSAGIIEEDLPAGDDYLELDEELE